MRGSVLVRRPGQTRLRGRGALRVLVEGRTLTGLRLPGLTELLLQRVHLGLRVRSLTHGRSRTLRRRRGRGGLPTRLTLHLRGESLLSLLGRLGLRLSRGLSTLLRSGAGLGLLRELSLSRRLGTLLGSLGLTVAGLVLLRELTLRLTLLRELTLLLAVAGLSLTLRLTLRLTIALHLRSVGLRVLGGLTRVRRQRRPGDVETEGRGGLSTSAGLTEARGLVDVDALDSGAVVAVVGGEGVQMHLNPNRFTPSFWAQ